MPDNSLPLAPRPWRMWGSELRSTKPGGDPMNANHDNTDLIATFVSRPNEHGGSHVAELYFVQELVASLPALLDAIGKYRAALTAIALHDTRAVAAALDMQAIAAAALLVLSALEEDNQRAYNEADAATEDKRQWMLKVEQLRKDRDAANATLVTQTSVIRDLQDEIARLRVIMVAATEAVRTQDTDEFFKLKFVLQDYVAKKASNATGTTPDKA